MTAKLDTVNAALAHLGETPLDTLDSDPMPTKLAKVLAQLDGLAGVERWAISRHPWLCCLSYKTLAPADRDGNWKWSNVFDLPGTAVKLWEVAGCDLAYETGTDVLEDDTIKLVIRANASSLNVAYTEAKGFDAYSPDLLAVIAFELASRTAGPLQNNYDAAARLHQQALEALSAAETGEAGQHGGAAPLIESHLAHLRREGAF